MYAFETTGSSASGGTEALAAALGPAVTAGGEAARTHVIVRSIVKTAAGWRAVVDVVVEPKAGAVQPGPARADGQDDEERKAKEKARLMLEEAYAAAQGYDIASQNRMLADEVEFMSLFLEISYQEFFEPVRNRFDFDFVHYITGSLLDESRRHAPDMELHAAAHAAGGSPLSFKPGEKRKPAPERKPEEPAEEPAAA